MVWILTVLVLYLWLILPRLPGRDMRALTGKRYAHRGLHDGNDRVMENSIAAFRLAQGKGLGVELDVQLSRDGQVMVFHDESLDRVLGMKGKLAEKTAQELKCLGVPTLEEALRVLENVPLIVEIKYYGDWRTLTDEAVRQMAAYPGPWCMESFHPLVVRHLKKRHPQVIRGQLALGADLRRMGHPVRDFVQKYLLHLFLSRPDFVALELGAEKHNLSWWILKGIFHTPMACWTLQGEKQENRAREKRYEMLIFEESNAKDG